MYLIAKVATRLGRPTDRPAEQDGGGWLRLQMRLSPLAPPSSVGEFVRGMTSPPVPFARWALAAAMQIGDATAIAPGGRKVRPDRREGGPAGSSWLGEYGPDLFSVRPTDRTYRGKGAMAGDGESKSRVRIRRVSDGRGRTDKTPSVRPSVRPRGPILRAGLYFPLSDGQESRTRAESDEGARGQAGHGGGGRGQAGHGGGGRGFGVSGDRGRQRRRQMAAPLAVRATAILTVHDRPGSG